MLTKETIKKMKQVTGNTTRKWTLRAKRLACELYQNGKFSKAFDFEHEDARMLCSLMKARD